MTMVNHFFRLALIAGPTLVTGAALYIGTKHPENGSLYSGDKTQDSSVEKVTSVFNNFNRSEYLFLAASFCISVTTFIIGRELVKMTSYKDTQLGQVMPFALALIASLGVLLIGLSNTMKIHQSGG